MFHSRGLVGVVVFFFLIIITGSVAAGINQWTTNGPDGGGIQTVAVDYTNSNVIYAATLATGIFKSTDGGVSWVAINNGIPFDGLSTYITSVYIDPIVNTRIYATTTIGLFRSDNAGENWAVLNSTYSANQVAVDPANNSIIYLATASGVFKSIDGGSSWIYLSTNFPAGTNFGLIKRIVFHPLNSSTIYIASAWDGVLVSSDDGASWNSINNGLTNLYVYSLAINPVNPQIMYVGTGAGIFKSIDGGANWIEMNSGITSTIKSTKSIQLDPASPDTAYAAVYSQVYKTTTGGASWSLVGSAISGLNGTSLNDMVMDPSNSSTIYGATQDTGVFKTTDAGLSWFPYNNGLHALNTVAVAIDPNAGNFVYSIGYEEGVFKSIDGGSTWLKKNPNSFNARVTSLTIDPVNPFIIYLSSLSPTFYKSIDAGEQWEVISTGLSSVIRSIAVDNVSNQTIYIATNTGVYKTTDGGIAWVAINSGLTELEGKEIIIDSNNSNILYLLTYNSGVFKSVDSGANWNEINNGITLNTQAGCSCVPYSFYHNPDNGYLYAGIATNLYRSMDGGLVWGDISNGLSNRAVKSLVADPNNSLILYAGTSRGVYKSGDGGLSWHPLSDGLTTADVRSISIDPNNPAVIYAGTYGGGVFQMLQQNRPPTPVGEQYSINEGSAYNVNAPGLIFNDTDPDIGDTLSVNPIPVTAPNNGSLMLSADGSFSYTHDGSETTSDSFTYEVSDSSGATATATVTITVNPVNDPPVANDDSYTLAEGATLTVDAASGVLANDSDVDINPSDTLIVINTTLAVPLHGSLSLNADGSFVYTHDGSETTYDSFQYQMSDGTVTGTATVTLTITPVNDPPLANDDSYTLDEGATLDIAAPGVLVNDTDAENDSLILSTTLVTAPTNGAVIVNADGSFSYTHNGDESRSDSFQYQISDGAGTSVGTVSFTINPVNDPPVANNDSYSLDEGATLSLDTALGVLANDIDVDLNPVDTLSVVPPLVSNPDNGTLSINADGSFTYIHNGSETTSDSFTYQMSDGNVSSTATVSLTINPVNDPPVAQNDSGYSVAEGDTLNIAAPGLLSNDSDVENNPLTISVTPVSAPSHGSVSLNGDGSFSYTHDGSETSNDSFEYQLSDGSANSSASVSIVITPVNDAPVGNSDSITTNEDTPYSGQLSGNDAENDSLTYTIASFPSKGGITLNANTGLYTYTPDANANGADAFTFSANDGQLESVEATVDISITPVNDLPVANNDSLTVIEDTAATGVVTANDVDGGDTLSYRIDTAPSLGTVNLDANTGSYTYTPNANQTGSDFFTFIANDGTGDSNSAQIDITIQALQDQPVASGGSLITDEDTPQSGQLIAVDADTQDTLSYAVISGPNEGNVNLDSATGAYTYTPNANYHGTDSFSFTASDGTNISDPATISIVINPVNDAPVASDGQLSASEDAVVQNQLIATDIDQDSLTYSLVSQASKGVVEILNAVNGTYRYTPNANETGTDSFSFQVSDGQLNSGVANIAILIQTSNDAPVADTQNIEVDEDSSVAITLTGSDVDNETINFNIETQPSRGSLSGNVPNLTYTPNANYNGTDSFVFSVSDPSNASHNATISITVNPQNDAPQAESSTLRVEQDIERTAILTASDVDGDTLSYSIVTQGDKGTVEIDAATGQYTYSPNLGAVGRDEFTYLVNDGTEISNAATVKVNINATGNEAPSAPQLIGPATSATDIGSTATFTWKRAQDSNGDELSYELQYCDDSEFASCAPIQVARGNHTTVTFVALGGSSAGMMLLGLLGAQRRRLLIIAILLWALTLLSACSDAANEASTPPAEKSAVTGMSYTVTGLSSQTIYYWKVIVDDNKGGVTESEVRSFSTL